MAKQKTEVLDLDVKGILADFSDLPDPRSHVNRRHILGEIIVMSIMAVIAGAEGPNPKPSECGRARFAVSA